MRILVTGATGFLGSHLLPLLAEAHHSLRVLARGEAPAAAALGAEVVTAGLRDRPTLRRALAGVEAVYHLAGQVEFDPADPAALFDLHVQGTRVLLEEAHAAGVGRVLLASTSGTVGISKEPRVATEADDYPLTTAARWPYYLSKIFQEKAALRVSRDTGLPLVVLNPSLLLGPGDERLGSTSVVWKLLQGRVPAMPGGGLSFVDVRDAALAFARALERGRPGERYLLGGHNLSFADLFGRLERLSGAPAPRLRLPSRLNVAGARLLGRYHAWRGSEPELDAPSVEMGEHFFYVDSSKATRELGFAPRDPQETLFETVRFLEERFGRPGAGSRATSPRPPRP